MMCILNRNFACDLLGELPGCFQEEAWILNDLIGAHARQMASKPVQRPPRAVDERKSSAARPGNRMSQQPVAAGAPLHVARPKHAAGDGS